MATFPVDDVTATAPCRTPAERRLTKVRARAPLGPLEASSDADSACDSGSLEVHPFVAAATEAWSNHHGFVFTPDAVWQLILQAVGAHVNRHSEELRAALVPFEGRRELTVRRDDFVLGDPNNDWPAFVAAINALIGQNAAPVVAELLARCRFSTTGPVEEACTGVAVMNVMQAYFGYRRRTCCGIPSMTIEGTPEDWLHILESLPVLEAFLLPQLSQAWLPGLRRVLEQFVAALQGAVDRDFWSRFVSKHATYGSGGETTVTGWLNLLFPEMAGGALNRYMLPEHLADLTDKEGRPLDTFGLGLARVPVEWAYYGQAYPMLLYAGFVGHTLVGGASLRPKLGWALYHAAPPLADPRATA